MLVIMLNCVTLGMFRPCEDVECRSERCSILEVGGEDCEENQGAPGVPSPLILTPFPSGLRRLHLCLLRRGDGNQDGGFGAVWAEMLPG